MHRARIVHPTETTHPHTPRIFESASNASTRALVRLRPACAQPAPNKIRVHGVHRAYQQQLSISGRADILLLLSERYPAHGLLRELIPTRQAQWEGLRDTDGLRQRMCTAPPLE